MKTMTTEALANAMVQAQKIDRLRDLRSADKLPPAERATRRELALQELGALAHLEHLLEKGRVPA
jgi:hypothetical protein